MTFIPHKKTFSCLFTIKKLNKVKIEILFPALFSPRPFLLSLPFSPVIPTFLYPNLQTIPHELLFLFLSLHQEWRPMLWSLWKTYWKTWTRKIGCLTHHEDFHPFILIPTPFETFLNSMLLHFPFPSFWVGFEIGIYNGNGNFGIFLLFRCLLGGFSALPTSLY